MHPNQALAEFEVVGINEAERLTQELIDAIKYTGLCGGLPTGYRGQKERTSEQMFTGPDLQFSQLQGRDLNPRPPGYEPGELPDCSTLPPHDSGTEPARVQDESRSACCRRRPTCSIKRA